MSYGYSLKGQLMYVYSTLNTHTHTYTLTPHIHTTHACTDIDTHTDTQTHTDTHTQLKIFTSFVRPFSKN